MCFIDSIGYGVCGPCIFGPETVNQQYDSELSAKLIVETPCLAISSDRSFSKVLSQAFDLFSTECLPFVNHIEHFFGYHIHSIFSGAIDFAF